MVANDTVIAAAASVDATAGRIAAGGHAATHAAAVLRALGNVVAGRSSVMACYIRAGGSRFDVDTFVSASTIEWHDVWHVGKVEALPWPRSPKEHQTSGLQIRVGDGDEFTSLLRDASEFMRKNRGELLRLASAPGVDQVKLDFGLTWDSNAAVRSITLPAELVVLAGEVHCAIEVCYYDLD